MDLSVMFVNDGVRGKGWWHFTN